MHGPSVDDLPSNPGEALLNLIGSTFSELKKIDNSLITKSNSVVGIKADLNRLVAEANNLNAQVIHQPPTVQAPTPIPVNNTQLPVLEPQVIEVQSTLTPTVVEVQKQVEDDGQLLLDFYRKITPEDINSRLADIDIKLNKIIMLLDGLKDKR